MFGDLPGYDDRVSTGHNSLQDAPAGWAIKPMRAVVWSRSERNRPDLPLLTVARERGVFVRRDDDENHNAIPDDLSNYKVARAGDLVVNKMKAWQGSLGLAPVDGIVSPAYYVFDFDIADRAFGQYLLRSKPYVALMAAASDGVRIGQWDLVLQRFRELPVLLPPADEQAAIVKYLGHAHARIDRAIAAKRKLIALLEEQKRAISWSVLSGRDDDRQVPLKYLVTVRGGMTPSRQVPEYWNGDVPWVTPKDMKTPFITGSTDTVTSRALSETGLQEVPEGAVLVVVRGMILARRVPIAVTRVAATINQDMKALQPKTGVRPDYLAVVLDSRQLELARLIESAGHGTRKLEPKHLGSVRVPLPSASDQQTVVERIEGSAARVTTAIARTGAEIELLREYRTRLTADVVTGQVDVRAAVATLPDLSAEQSLDAGGDDEDESYDEELLAAAEDE